MADWVGFVLPVWALHDVWDSTTSTLLLPAYFAASPVEPSKPVSFVPDYWRPAWELWARKIRKAHPECIHFIQPPVFHQPPVPPDTMRSEKGLTVTLNRRRSSN